MTLQNAFRLAAWLCIAAITTLSLVSPKLRPVTAVPHDIEHVLIFAFAGFAMGLGYPRRIAHLIIGMVVFAAAIELSQFFVPGRHPRMIDFVVDALGGCAGVMFAMLIARFVRPAMR